MIIADQMLKQIGTADRDSHVEAVRRVLHGAMALYLARYLNVPPARIPGEGGELLDDQTANAEEIRAALLDAFAIGNDRSIWAREELEPARRLPSRCRLLPSRWARYGPPSRAATSRRSLL
jgi:hypothetical protein